MVAVTLTMKQRIGPEKLTALCATSNFRHFSNVLNQKVFGNSFRRHSKRLTIIPMLETSAWDRLHYHVTIEVPERLELQEFETLIRRSWVATDFGYDEVDVTPVYSSGWIRYCLKKFDASATLDIENVFINR